MKNTWNIRKKEDAVSPVIATILMVAITVVLAAVLYVMVIGFGSGGASTPAGAWKEVGAVDATTAKLEFGAFTTDVQPMDVRFVVTSTTGAGTGTYNFQYAPTADNTTMNPANAGYFDFNPAGNLINQGDSITIWGLTSGATYTVQVFHIDTESTVSMTGDSGTWSQP
ncbi:MAG: type IV pilin N-terminal domain-containing protein [Thermoplasmata archaeon]|nr:type IV pilin N-terminal domain-containing protein [Thermoplasmata archaeon]